jgi:hypothetical protein
VQAGKTDKSLVLVYVAFAEFFQTVNNTDMAKRMLTEGQKYAKTPVEQSALQTKLSAIQ